MKEIIIQKLIKTINKNSLINKGDRVLVALSGGADSVFLLYALNRISEKYGFKLGACHVEHGIRGESSLRDLEFSKELCQSLNIDFYFRHFDVPRLAKSEKLSVEAAGRKVRYEYFSRVMDEENYNILATAHHMDDKIETIVMNLLRGCGLRGFAGIEYKNGSIIRPLLDVKKNEIIKYLHGEGITFCTDETNADTNYTRNKVRHSLLPALKEFNPAVEESLLRQSAIFSDEDDFLNKFSSEEYKKCFNSGKLDILKLKSCHKAIQRRIIYKYLASVKGSCADITATDIEACLSLCEKGETGKKSYLSDGIEVSIDYGFFTVCRASEVSDFQYRLSFNVPVEVKELGVKITLYPDGGKLNITENDEVFVRNRRDGDVFCPRGMDGSKKLKNYFTDNKISRTLRSRIPIIVVNGEIASIVGYRDDRRFFGNGTCRVVTEKI